MYQKLFLLVTVVFFSTTFSFSQAVIDTLVASQYYKKGDSLLTRWEFDTSVYYFEKASSIYIKSEAWNRVKSCYNKISELQLHKANYDKALLFAYKTIEIKNIQKLNDKREDANAYDNIGAYYEMYKSDFKTALYYYKKAFEIREIGEHPAEMVTSYLNIGKINEKLGLYTQAIKDFEIALKMNTLAFGKKHHRNAAVYLEIGNSNLHNWKFETAQLYYKKAFDIYSKKFGLNNLKTIEAIEKIGIIHYQKGENDTSLKIFENILNITLRKVEENHPKIASIYGRIGDIYKEKGDYQKALIYQKKALKIKKEKFSKYHIELSEIYFAMGILYYRTGMYDKALEFYYKDVLIKEKILGDNALSLATTYNNIGLVLVLKNLYNKAGLYFTKSASIKEEIYGRKHPAVSDSYNNLGLTYSKQGNNEKALFYYKKSLESNVEIHPKQNRLIANSLKEIARIYLAQGKLNSALAYLKKSLDLRIKFYGENHPNVSMVYNLIGNTYHEKKEYKKALVYYKKAIKVQEEISERNGLIAASSYNSIANTYAKIKNYKKAQRYYDKALNINLKSAQKNTDIFDPNNYSYPEILIDTFTYNAKMLQVFFSENQNISLLKKSIAIYERADKLINHIRKSYDDYQDKISFSKKAKEIYRGAINAQLSLYHEVKEKKILEKALYYAEKSKANTLKELLNESSAKNFARLPKKLLEKEQNSKTDYAFYQSKISKELSRKMVDSIKLTSYENKLFTITKRQDSISKVLEKKFPKYHQLKYQDQVVSVSEIQHKLDSNRTMLEFFTTDSITYVFIVSKHKLAIKELSTPTLAVKVEKLHKAITSENNPEYRKRAHILHQELIAPIADQITGNELIIIPDGPLWHLNFELLLTKKENITNESKDLSYFLRKYVISYANSATLLFNPLKNSNKTQKIQSECLAFSFSDTVKVADAKKTSLVTLRNTFDDLPGTRKEIRAISSIIDGQYYYGNQAIESNFKQYVSQYNILHLALHGEVDNENPENSKLYFTKTKDSIEDNLLYSHELFSLNIPAELTVLSACNTGAGKIAKGEGIMSLGNAFQYAGTKSLLLSSWEVSDKTTPELMKYFYTNLKNGMNKAKALQQAKLQYLNTTETFYSSPFYWGSFYLVGDTSPLHFDKSINKSIYWIIGILIMGLILLMRLIYLKKNRNINPSIQ